MYCRHCGAKTDIRKGACPVCGANQKARRFSFFGLVAVLLACAMFAALLFFGNRLETGPALTSPAAYTAPTDTAADTESGDFVFVTHAGTKYHKESCNYLNDSKERLSLQEAQALGYTPCAFCFGE